MSAPELQFVHSKTKPTATGGWERERMVCQRPCRVKGVSVANKSAAGFWLWICNSPTNGALEPDWCPIYVPASSAQSIDWTLSPERFDKGCYVVASADPLTKTDIGANDAFFHVSYALDTR